MKATSACSERNDALIASSGQKRNRKAVSERLVPSTLLQAAHRAVESITLDREVHHLRDELTPRYAEMVYNGLWFSPEREALQQFMDSVQRRVNGEARLKLFKGTATIEGRRSATHTLYDEGIATFEADDVYDQSDATGFIRLRALRLRTLGARRISEGE